MPRKRPASPLPRAARVSRIRPAEPAFLAGPSLLHQSPQPIEVKDEVEALGSPYTSPEASRLPRSISGSPIVLQSDDANIRNLAPVARIMKSALPDNAKIAKEAKECMQECVSEFISFITSEGMGSQYVWVSRD